MHYIHRFARHAFVALILSCLCIGCSTFRPSSPTEILQDFAKIPRTELTIEPASKKTATIKIKEKPTEDILYSIELPNERNDQALNHVYDLHYHNHEYHRSNLYIVRRIGNIQIDTGWTDELWRYDEDRKGVKLFAEQGLDFRASPDGAYIALTNNSDVVKLINAQGELVHVWDFSQYPNNSGLDLVGWAYKHGRSRPHYLWIALFNDTGPAEFLRLSARNQSLVSYQVDHLSIGDDYALNPEKKWLAFSNYPTLFDEDSKKEFEQSGRLITFYLYDLDKKTLKAIKEAPAHQFSPLWISDDEVEYNDLKHKDRRKVYRVKD